MLFLFPPKRTVHFTTEHNERLQWLRQTLMVFEKRRWECMVENCFPTYEVIFLPGSGVMLVRLLGQIFPFCREQANALFRFFTRSLQSFGNVHQFRPAKHFARKWPQFLAKTSTAKTVLRNSVTWKTLARCRTTRKRALAFSRHGGKIRSSGGNPITQFRGRGTPSKGIKLLFRPPCFSHQKRWRYSLVLFSALMLVT